MTKFFNVCVLGQVDSGKTAFCKAILKYLNIENSNLDSLYIEYTRGITVKLKHTKILHNNTVINLLDTPGHSELVEEVSRAASICSNIILIIDINRRR